jgi:glycosyltransferase involved in cell wall biosynthesis
MSVDVIIPTYGSSPYLLNAINSAINQGEIVQNIFVIDDGSPPDIVERLRLETSKIEKVQFISADRHSNPAIIRNIGIRAATSDYIAFLDADDCWQEGKILKQLSEMKKRKVDFVCSNALKVNFDNKTNYFIGRQNKKIKTHNLIRANGVITSTVLVDRFIFAQIGGFPEDYSVRGVEDYFAWLRLSLDAQMFYLDEVTAEYLINPHGISQTVYFDNSVHALARFLQELKEIETKSTLARVKFLLFRMQILLAIWIR